jgi:hypothetical protein
VKARKVKGIDAEAPAAGEVAKIVAVRLDELCGFMPGARDPAAVHMLHDMRIAAKRLRYVLELFAPAFGPYAADAARQVRRLQDIIGEIHDCDVTRPRIAALRQELLASDARAVRGLAGKGAKDLDMRLVAQAPHRATYRGLQTLDVALAARRELLFERFLQRWDRLEEQRFRDRLTEAITSRSHDGNGGAGPVGIPSGESPA